VWGRGGVEKKDGGMHMLRLAAEGVSFQGRGVGEGMGEGIRRAAMQPYSHVHKPTRRVCVNTGAVCLEALNHVCCIHFSLYYPPPLSPFATGYWRT
jgi:hypothetical protein